MDLKHLGYITEIANTGSFSEAAKNLYISQPSLSQYVQRLESKYGVSLFNRTRSHITLTDAGRLYIRTGAALLDMEQKITDSVLSGGVNDGKVVIGISPYRDCYILAKALKLFDSLYPRARIRLFEHRNSILEDMLTKGDIDMMIGPHTNDSPAFIRTKLFSERMLIAVAPNYWFFHENDVRTCSIDGKRYPSINLEDLSSARFIMLSAGTVLRSKAEDLCRRAGFTPRVILESKDIGAVHAMAAAGIGVTFVPESFVACHPLKSDAEYYLPMDCDLDMEMSIIRCAGRPLPPAAAEFARILLSQWETGAPL